jgi:DNA repair exonuclease SbcCD ATPase subunit
MATEQAAENPDTTPLAAAATPAVSKDDIAQLLQEALDRPLTALRDDGHAVQQQLDSIRSALQTAVLADVMVHLAETDAPEQSELQRRARAIQVELTLRRQEVALEEWRRKLKAAEQEAERQRQLFARLEADFERRSGDFERRSADFARQSAEFGQTALLARETEAALATATEAKLALDRRADQLARELAAAVELNQARQRMIDTLEQDLARVRQEKAELGEELARRETVLTEAERRIEELRNSRWRQLGIGLGLAKRATFEK